MLTKEQKNLWQPPLSPIGMLQEFMWPDEWKLLVVCMLHNQTSRKQVDKVYQELFYKFPNARSMSKANQESLAKILKPLGLYNRRSKGLIKFSQDFLTKNWKMPSELYGCGKYADDCYTVFFIGNIRDVNPTDHALNDYVDWIKKEYKVA